jgi:putative tryptophan/tyrosine transport system substrate-binding protein
MNRREFIAGLGSTTALPALPRAGWTKQMAVPVVGFLSASSLESLQEPIVALREALATFGYVEGRNVAIEYRVADDHYDRMPQLAADLVRREVKVIVSMGGSPTLLAVRQASWCDPAGGRPVQVRGSARLVASVAWSLATVAAKRTQQLRGVWGLLSDESSREASARRRE